MVKELEWDFPQIKQAIEDGRYYLFITANLAIVLDLNNRETGYTYYENKGAFTPVTGSGFPLLYKTTVSETEDTWEIEVFLDPFNSIQIVHELVLLEEPWYNNYEDDSPIEESMICMNCYRFKGNKCDRDMSFKKESDTCDKFASSQEYEFNLFWEESGKDMFDSHLEHWFFKEYHTLNRAEVKLKFNEHDNSLEEERAEEWLQRDLELEEYEKIKNRFLDSILNNIDFSGRQSDEDFQVATGYYNLEENLVTPAARIEELSKRIY